MLNAVKSIINSQNILEKDYEETLRDLPNKYIIP